MLIPSNEIDKMTAFSSVLAMTDSNVILDPNAHFT